MAMGILNGIGMSMLGSALLGVPTVHAGSEAPGRQDPGSEVRVSFERAGVDAEGCVLYRLTREQEGRSLRVRTGLFRQQRVTGEWTRGRPADCVKAQPERLSPP